MASSYTWNERFIITGGETVAFRDRTIFLDSSGGGFTVLFPVNPEAGEQHLFKDFNFNLLANNVTIDGNGNNVEQPFAATVGATALLNKNGEAVTWEFFGTDLTWHILNAYQV